MEYDICKHGRIRIHGLVFWCNQCVREEIENPRDPKDIESYQGVEEMRGVIVKEIKGDNK